MSLNTQLVGQSIRVSRSQRTKLTAIVLTLIVSIAAFGTHISGRLFPWLPVSLGIGAAVLLVSGPKIRFHYWIGGGLFLGVFYRVYVYLWPASMIGMDPDKFAAAVNQIIAAGDVSAINDLIFYSQSPMAHVFAAEVGLTTGLPGQDALVAYALLLGLVLPLSAAALARRLVPDDGRTADYAGGIAATLAAISTNTVLFGYWPIPQAIAVLFWAGLLLSLFRYYNPSNTADRWLFLPFVIGLLLSHKLGVFLVVATLGSTVLILRFNRFRVAGKGHGRRYRSREQGWILIAMTGLVLSIQWVFLTEWIRAVVLTAIVPLLSPQLIVAAAPPSFQAAGSATVGLIATVTRNGNWLVLVPMAGFASLLLWYRNSSPPAALTLGAGLVTAVLLGFSILSSGGAATQRVLFFGELVLVVLVAVVISLPFTRTGDRWMSVERSVAVLMLCLLVVSQVGTVGAVPDYPDRPRYYLTSEEVASKFFLNSYATDTVYADFYYARETVVFGRDATYETGSNASTAGFEPIGPPLLNGSVTNPETTDWQYFAFRRHAHIYRTSIGIYKLQYDPEPALDTASHRIYADGDVIVYSR